MDFSLKNPRATEGRPYGYFFDKQDRPGSNRTGAVLCTEVRRGGQPPTTAVIASPNGARQSPGRQYRIATCYQEIPTGFALGMTDLGDCAFVWTGRLSDMVGGVMTPPYKGFPRIPEFHTPSGS